MTGTVQITLRDIPPSENFERWIRRKVAGLEKFHPDILSCRVVAQAPRACRRKGAEFVISLGITVASGQITVNRDHHEDIYVALREAFRAARRELDGYPHPVRGEAGPGTDQSGP
jgi:ribosome-associated translation inhibitor RaiA